MWLRSLERGWELTRDLWDANIPLAAAKLALGLSLPPMRLPRPNQAPGNTLKGFRWGGQVS